MYKEIAAEIKNTFPDERDWTKVSVALNASFYLLLVDSDFERFCEKVYEVSMLSLNLDTPLSIEIVSDFLFALYDQDFNILNREAEYIYEQIAERYRADIKV
jgi:hypothetical protein